MTALMLAEPILPGSVAALATAVEHVAPDSAPEVITGTIDRCWEALTRILRAADARLVLLHLVHEMPDRYRQHAVARILTTSAS